MRAVFTFCTPHLELRVGTSREGGGLGGGGQARMRMKKRIDFHYPLCYYIKR